MVLLSVQDTIIYVRFSMVLIKIKKRNKLEEIFSVGRPMNTGKKSIRFIQISFVGVRYWASNPFRSAFPLQHSENQKTNEKELFPFRRFFFSSFPLYNYMNHKIKRFFLSFFSSFSRSLWYFIASTSNSTKFGIF